MLVLENEIWKLPWLVDATAVLPVTSPAADPIMRRLPRPPPHPNHASGRRRVIYINKYANTSPAVTRHIDYCRLICRKTPARIIGQLSLPPPAKLCQSKAALVEARLPLVRPTGRWGSCYVYSFLLLISTDSLLKKITNDIIVWWKLAFIFG